MATTYYRGYRIWHDRTHRKYFAFVWPPGRSQAPLRTISVTPRQGAPALLRRVRALIDVEETKKQRATGTD